MLVRGKDVVRYHVDTESEDDESSESEESESQSDAGDGSTIAIGDDEYTSRMAICENCKQEFDVTLNDRGDCVWHPGIVFLSLSLASS